MTRFRVKPHSEPRQPRTAAQEAATDRAFRIFRLRGLYEQACLLTGERRDQAQAAVDAELALMGAEPHAKRMAEREAVWSRIAEEAERETEIPF